jgi:hypothetical protein
MGFKSPELAAIDVETESQYIGRLENRLQSGTSPMDKSNITASSQLITELHTDDGAGASAPHWGSTGHTAGTNSSRAGRRNHFSHTLVFCSYYKVPCA